MSSIRFGTEGWRGMLADDYTFYNVRAVARGSVGWFKKQPRPAIVAIGHDTRFLGNRFAAAVADELTAAGLEARLCTGPLPTPALSYYVVKEQLAGGIMLTASHNPAEWNGFKVKRPEGSSVLAEDAKAIEAGTIAILQAGLEPAPESEKVLFDIRDNYVNRVVSLVDRAAISRAKLNIVADLMHGSGAGYFDEALRRVGCQEVRVLRPERDPTFEGKNPEPIGHNLEISAALTSEQSVSVGLATDGDADRFGMMAHGEYVDIQRTIVLILYHLLKNRQWRGVVVRAVNVTSMVDRLCERYGVEVMEKSVGFKNIAPVLLASPDKVIMGVEESGGFGLRGHVPDRDGALAALTVCEALAYEKKPVRDILEDIFTIVGGRRYFDRLDIHLSLEQRDRLDRTLSSLEAQNIGGRRVTAVTRLDGNKYILQGGAWLLMRLSGTEPLIRIYGEGRSEEDVNALLEAGKEMVLKAAAV